jgi:hypothetical protein
MLIGSPVASSVDAQKVFQSLQEASEGKGAISNFRFVQKL